MLTKFESARYSEYYFAIDFGLSNSSLIEQLIFIMNKYCEYLSDENSYIDNTYYFKFYLSDIVNQKSQLDKFMLENYPNIYYLSIGQKPTSGAKVALEGVFLKSMNAIEIINKGYYSALSTGDYTHIIGHISPEEVGSSYLETKNIFGQLNLKMHNRNATVEDNIIRTWFYIKDIDNNYQGMVDSRNEYFDNIGMNKNTHYIASTGIQGVNENHKSYITFNYLSMIGIHSDQIKYLKALNYLNPTHEYNVAFERGVRVNFNDQMRYYISGTASIDNKGKVLHINDVKSQLERVIVNIKSLLEDGEGYLADLKIMIIYLRDPSDYKLINDFMGYQTYINCPYLILEGAVCRPEWLIEAECIAIKRCQTNRYRNYL